LPNAQGRTISFITVNGVTITP